MNPRRVERMQQLIKQRVAMLLDHEIADPRRGLVTVTRVKVDRDLATCLVFWSVLGDERVRRRNEEMLEDAAGWVQREIAAVLHTRVVPRVKFVYDEGLVQSQRIADILQQLASERGPATGDDAGESDSSEPDSSGSDSREPDSSGSDSRGPDSRGPAEP